MKALYRRCRPVSLSEVIGQPQVTELLAAALKDNKINHAYLFVGPRGTGKTSVARIFAHEINNFQYKLEDDYVDIIEIDGASNRGIDNIRELREKAAIAPTSGKYKVYIIDEVHMLTKEAFNALLKTLEEPPSHVIFIMATTDAHKVPVTITSRAQTFTFKLADAKTMLKYLKKICQEEKIKISDEALEVIVKRGGGSFRDTLSLLDQISTLSPNGISKDLVISAMGLAEDEKIAQLLSDYEDGDLMKISQSLKELWLTGVKAETLAEEMIALIIANPKPSLMALLYKLADIKAPFAEAKLLAALARAASSNDINGGAQSAKVQPSVQRIVETKATSPDTPPTNTTTMSNTTSDWDEFLNRLYGMNDAIATQVKKCRYDFSNGELHLYPNKKVTRMILVKDANRKLLSDAAGSVKVIICEIDEAPNDKSDELISKISDIMGGKVQNDGGGDPF